MPIFVKQLRLVSPKGTHDPVAKPPILQSRTSVHHQDDCSDFPLPVTEWTNVERVYDDAAYADAREQQ